MRRAAQDDLRSNDPAHHASQDKDPPVSVDPALIGDRNFTLIVNAASDMASQWRRIESELRRSRRRAIAAADLERERIERYLHDGAQQRLVALRVRLGDVHDLFERDCPLGAQLLEELDRELEVAIDELRALAHDLHPHLLADLGVVDALRSAARRAPGPVTVRAQDVGRYSAEVESAVYFCALEALQNASKHAGGGSPISIRLVQDGQLIRFQVGDRGVGFDSRKFTAGIGLRHMKDRIGAVGGELSIHSVPGAGTTISGSVPALPLLV
jgi:signal transduction histidine kinase